MSFFFKSQTEDRNVNQVLWGKGDNVRKGFAGHRWLMPVILATQETEIRKIPV
jgi:hypothetical protein